MSERMFVSETIGDFVARNGRITSTIEKRFTSDTLKSPACLKKSDGTKVGSGYIVQLGPVDIKKSTPLRTIQKLLKELPNDAKLVEMYPTHFCSNCTRSSWQFVEDESSGHATCRGCGVVQRTTKSNMGTLYLKEDGHSNKSMWECTPGMDHRDTCLTKNGKRLDIGRQRPTSHLRNYWRIQKKVDGIAQRWNFAAIESIVRLAKAKLKKFYYMVHDGVESDNVRKMPHGGAALAAACFYCAVLEFETRTGYKTLCSLPAIQESAQTEVDRKQSRKTRDVTDLVILKYAKLLKQKGLCQALVPHIGSETLKFTPTSAALEHARMALFGECRPVKFHLPLQEKWGLQIGDTRQGVLYIDSLHTDGIAFETGLRKGDFILQFQGNTMSCDMTPARFSQQVVAAKQHSSQTQVEISIMRKKKK
jgi:hypothetical protein